MDNAEYVMALAAMARECYASADARGFHDKGKVSTLELAMLVVTECAELAEWERNGRPPSDHIPEFSGAEEESIVTRLSGAEEELMPNRPWMKRQAYRTV